MGLMIYISAFVTVTNLTITASGACPCQQADAAGFPTGLKQTRIGQALCGVQYLGVHLVNLTHIVINDVTWRSLLQAHMCTLPYNIRAAARNLVSASPSERGTSISGHHGIVVGGTDNLVTNVDFQTRYIHDFTVVGGMELCIWWQWWHVHDFRRLATCHILPHTHHTAPRATACV
jgi:hypothetical protein